MVLGLWLLFADGVAHFSVSNDVLIFGVVHDAEFAVAEGFGDGHGDGGFSFDDLGAHFLGAGGHFLLGGDGGGAAHFGFGLCDLLIGFGLLGLEAGSDVVSDIDIGDIDGKDFERGGGIDSFFENEARDGVGIFQDTFIGRGGADGGHNAFADTGNDGLFSRTSDEAVEVSADGDSGADVDGDPVFSDGIDFGDAGAGIRAIDDFRVNGSSDGFEDGLAGVLGGKIDGAGAVEGEGDAGFLGGDEGEDDIDDVTTGEVVGFELIGAVIEAGLGGGDAAVHNDAGMDFSEAHQDEIGEADGSSGGAGLNPEAEKIDHDETNDEEKDDSDDCDGEGRNGIAEDKGGESHATKLTGSLWVAN